MSRSKLYLIGALACVFLLLVTAIENWLDALTPFERAYQALIGMFGGLWFSDLVWLEETRAAHRCRRY